MILHDLIPEYHFSEKHKAITNASSTRIYTSIATLDLSRSAMVKLLYSLRRMPRTSLTLEGMKEIEFNVLGKGETRELVIGLIGRFWKPIPEIIDIAPQAFNSFNEPGYAKAALNYFIEKGPNGNVLSTETRIYCTSTGALVAFSAYWAIIRPFSGLIRRAMLKEILRGAEQ